MILYQSIYFLEKSTNTFADNLAAFGLAFVLNGIVDHRAQVRLEDHGPAYAVICEPGIREEWVQSCQFFAGAPFLITVDNSTKTKVVKGTSITPDELPPPGGEVVADYETEKQSNAAFFEWLKTLPSEGRKQAVRGELSGPASPHSDWDLFRAINPAGLQAYNTLLGDWWQGQEAFPDLVRALLKMTQTIPNDLASAEKAWAEICKGRGWEKPKAATASQLFNPAQGKGTNYAKSVWSAPGNLKGFWLLEFLKIVGLRYGGITRLVRGTKDRKTYALAPHHLGWGDHRAVMDKFKKAMSGHDSAVRSDIFASLRYTQALLEHLQETRQIDPEAELFGRPASDFVSGFEMAFYKSLGNSAATMNIASINLPGWVYLKNQESLGLLQEALNEHVAIVRSLDESRGDQFELLTLYRDFLSANDFTPFFAFTTSYSSFIIRQLERRQYVRPFTTTTLEVLFMNSDNPQKTYSTIVQNEGFKNVAYAIRHSTVVPQGRKAKGNKPTVDVRYGLGQQLAQKANYPADFLAELAEFIHLYNAENSQLRENKRNPFRKNVTTADIEAVIGLVDEFGSKVVCNMLVAYGYAREPYEGKDDDQQPEDFTGEGDTPDEDSNVEE